MLPYHAVTGKSPRHGAPPPSPGQAIPLAHRETRKHESGPTCLIPSDPKSRWPVWQDTFLHQDENRHRGLLLPARVRRQRQTEPHDRGLRSHDFGAGPGCVLKQRRRRSIGSARQVFYARPRSSKSPMGNPVMMAAQQQVHRTRPLGCRRHDHSYHGTGRAAACTVLAAYRLSGPGSGGGRPASCALVPEPLCRNLGFLP
jgi:hypothetical protein